MNLFAQGYLRPRAKFAAAVRQLDEKFSDAILCRAAAIDGEARGEDADRRARSAEGMARPAARAEQDDVLLFRDPLEPGVPIED